MLFAAAVAAKKCLLAELGECLFVVGGAVLLLRAWACGRACRPCDDDRRHAFARARLVAYLIPDGFEGRTAQHWVPGHKFVSIGLSCQVGAAADLTECRALGLHISARVYKYDNCGVAVAGHSRSRGTASIPLEPMWNAWAPVLQRVVG